MPVAQRCLRGQRRYFAGIIGTVSTADGWDRVVIRVPGIDDYSTPHRFLEAAKSANRPEGPPIKSKLHYPTLTWVLFYNLHDAGRPKNWGQVQMETFDIMSMYAATTAAATTEGVCLE
jgi:hypothetical protein